MSGKTPVAFIRASYSVFGVRAPRSSRDHDAALTYHQDAISLFAQQTCLMLFLTSALSSFEKDQSRTHLTSTWACLRHGSASKSWIRHSERVTFKVFECGAAQRCAAGKDSIREGLPAGGAGCDGKKHVKLYHVALLSLLLRDTCPQ